MDYVKMGGSVARAVDIPNTVPVLEFSLMHDSYAFPLQYSMAIILRRSQLKRFSAPEEWVTFIGWHKAEIPIEEARVELVADETKKVGRKIWLEDKVVLIVPRVELQADETPMLTQRGKMTSTAGSHGHINSRGVDYALLDDKYGAHSSKLHHPTGKPKGSCGAQDGGVLLGEKLGYWWSH
jgi:hypothetical protein